MFSFIDKVEDKYFASDASVAPGGWCCHCWCCCSIELAAEDPSYNGDTSYEEAAYAE